MSTHFHPAPIPWAQFPIECFWYFLVMCVPHVLVIVVGNAILAVWFRREPLLRQQRSDRLGLFIVVLLVVGSLFNGLWSCLVWDRLYDSSDYVVDFMPFWPITQSRIDRWWGSEYLRGRLLGVSLFELQLVWFAFACGVWAVTVCVYRWLSRPPSALLLSDPGARLAASIPPPSAC